MDTSILDLRPVRGADVALGPAMLRGPHTLHVVLDRNAGKLFEVGPKEHFVLARLDGVTTLAEIAEGYARQFGRRLRPDDLARLMRLFGSRGLLAGAPGAASEGGAPARVPLPRPPVSMRRGQRPLVNASALVNWLYRWVRPGYSGYFLVPLAVAILAMLAVLFARLPELAAEWRASYHLVGPGIAITALLWLSGALHELGHAVTSRHFGGQAWDIGIRWNFPLIYLYTTVPDMLVFPLRRQRVATAASGVIVNLAFQLPFFGAWLALPSGRAHNVIGEFLLTSTVLALMNYLPLVRLDGQAILSNLLNVNRLARESYRYLWLRVAALVGGRGTGPDYPARARRIYRSYGTVSLLSVTAATGVVIWLAVHLLPGRVLAVIGGGAAVLVVASTWQPAFAVVVRWRARQRRAAPRHARHRAGGPLAESTPVAGEAISITTHPRSVMRFRPAMETEPVISVENVCKAYGDTIALDGISLTVCRGEFFGVIGPNGAGKTTLIEIMEGLRRADSGRVTVLGERPWPRNRLLLPRIGLQTQAHAFFPRLTVAEHLETVAALYGADSRRVRQKLALVGLADKGRIRVDKLSVGQRQRLAIASALVHDPDLIFLDEPTAALDPRGRRDLWQVLRDIAAEGRTIVYTTHHLDEAEALCDRVALIGNGSLIALDTPDLLVRRFGDGHAASTGMPARAMAPSLEDVYLELTGREYES